MRNYLIPANAKKSTLILGFFNELDLIVFGIGVTFTIVMLLVLQTSKLSITILVLLPSLISGFLVMPVPHYHNIMQLIINIFNFYTNRRKYKWKGWCIEDEIGEK